MKRILIGFLITPAAALADTRAPAPGQLTNAAKACKVVRSTDAAQQMAALAGKTFAQAYGTRSNAYGKCVSDQAKKLAATSVALAEAAGPADVETGAPADCEAWMEAKDTGQAVLDGQSVAQKYRNGN